MLGQVLDIGPQFRMLPHFQRVPSISRQQIFDLLVVYLEVGDLSAVGSARFLPRGHSREQLPADSRDQALAFLGIRIEKFYPV